MPSDFEPKSTTTWVPVSLTTVPLITWSSPTDSSVSVVKFSSAAAKSSLAADVWVSGVVDDEADEDEAVAGASCVSAAGVGAECSEESGAEACAPAGEGCTVSGASRTADPPLCESCSGVMVSRVVSGLRVSSYKVIASLPRTHVRDECGTITERCLADCWRGRQVALRPPWRTTLVQSQLPERRIEPASNGDSSTIAMASEQCQT